MQKCRRTGPVPLTCGENEHREIGWALIKRIKEELLPFGKIESDARAEGNTIIMVMTGTSK